MIFTKPFPWQSAIKKLNQKVVTPATLNSAEWQRVPVAIRERAFFSATIESARFLQDAKDTLQDFLSSNRERLPGGQQALKAGSRARFVKLMREKAKAWGMQPLDPKKQGTIQDITTEGRLRLIFETQTKQAHEFAWWQDGMDPMTLQMFPAMRFYRQRPVKDPRPYHEENRGVVKRKDDLPFWISMNRDFQVPWAPWGFNSGMDTEEVSRQEAEDLGLVQPGEILDSPQKDFNDFTKASLNGLDEGTIQWLRKSLGDLARFDLDAVWLKAPTGFPAPGEEDPLNKPHQTAEEARQKILELEKRYQGETYATPEEARAAPEKFRLDAIRLISLPKEKRASIKPAGRISGKIKEPVGTALDFLGRMINKTRRTDVEFKVATLPVKTDRAFYWAYDKTARIPNPERYRMAYCKSTAIHEIMHHFDRWKPEIMDATRKFLEKRRRESPPGKGDVVQLRKIDPGRRWKADEYGFEDRWRETGNDIYVGKIYAADKNINSIRSSEVFTMGMERLWNDPVKFARQDPEYFNFIISTLQDIPPGG